MAVFAIPRLEAARPAKEVLQKAPWKRRNRSWKNQLISLHAQVLLKRVIPNYANVMPELSRAVIRRCLRITTKIMKIRSSPIVVRFNTIRARNSVGRYSNSTRFFPAGRITPVCHWFTRRARRFVPFTQTFQAGVNHSFKIRSEAELHFTEE